MKILASIALFAATACMGILSNLSAQTEPATRSQATACPHGIEAAKCPFCDPTRIERLGMCKEHGVPEALCVKCRPFLEQAFIAAGDWCKEHVTPESQCAICNPATTKQAAARAQSAGADHRWQREPSVTCSTSATTITLASPEVQRAVGLEYMQVQAAPLTRSIERNAVITYNANRYARLSSRAPGVVSEVRRDLGDTVKKGDVLAVVDSAELGSAKSDLLQVMETGKLWEANAARERALVEKGVGVEREALEAETKAKENLIQANRARQRLRTFGLSQEQVDAVEKNGDTSPLLQLLAPFDGVIIERDDDGTRRAQVVVIGELVEPSKPVLAVADTNTMWALVDLTEADLAVVQTGQHAIVTLDGLPGKMLSGKVTWISTQLDAKTRAVKARVELENSKGLLRANMFGRARIAAGESRQAITVPKEAVQWEGCCNVAFVRTDTAGTTFRPARLVLGYDAGNRYEVIEGLVAGDTIVTRGSYILKNEILKNSVGAGCCEVDHLKK